MDMDTVEMIVNYTPKNVVLAAVIILFLFGIKSLTVVFPLSVLYLSSGILFSPILAVLISTLGLSITITIPYWIGRGGGKRIIEKLCKKYPKVNEIAVCQNQNAFFACFITRIVGFLPGDMVSLYFGACKIRFSLYLAAGVSGSFLSIVTSTLLGNKLKDPFSRDFILVLICRILVSTGSIMIQYVMKKKKKEEV